MEKNLINSNGPDGEGFLSAVNKKERLYQVPPAYFEGLAGEIMARIRTGLYSRKMEYQVPDGYFAGLADQVLRRIKGEGQQMSPVADSHGFRSEEIFAELATVAPLLLEIGNRNVYQAPQDYFTTLSPLAALQEARPQDFETAQMQASEKEAKVIPLTPKKKLWRAAVAAAAVLGVLVSGERYLTHTEHQPQPAASSNQFAATIPTGNDSFQQNLSGLSDVDILNYLNIPDPSGKDSINEKAATETQKAISGMTNEELENYLERTPATY